MLASEKVRALCATASTLALVTSLVSLPQAVRAADATDTNKSSSGYTTIGEVVVTAQKREENLQTVPVAITAFTSSTRDRAGIISAQDLMNFTPGVTYDPQSDHLDVRGIGRVTTYIGTDPGVAVYTDGFYVGSAANLNTTTLETERVEVLRGPQGTLYGRNSIGGAVNQISRRPNDTLTGEIRATANDYLGETIEARISGPVTDWLRLSGYVEGNDQAHGYMHVAPPHPVPAAPAMPGDPTHPATPAYPAATCQSLNFASIQPMTCGEFNNRPSTGGIGNGFIADFQASFNVGTEFDGWVDARVTRQFSRPGQAGITTPWNPIALTVPSVFYGFQGVQQPGLYDPRAIVMGPIPTTDYTDTKKFVTQDTWHGPGFDAKFTGGYWDYTNDFIQNGTAVPDSPPGIYAPVLAVLGIPPSLGPSTFIPYPQPTINPKDPQSTVPDPNQLNNGFQQQFRAWSTELDFTSTGKGPLQWLAGAYYYDEHNNTETGYQEINTPVYNYVTDYLFSHQGCLPVSVTIPGVGPLDNVATGPGSCLLQIPVSVLGSHPGFDPLTQPSTLPNYPSGPLDQAMSATGPHRQAVPGSGCLYCTVAYLRTQTEGLFAQLDWRPTSQWHFTGGFRYSWDQRRGYESEIDVYWIPLVATQAQAAAYGFPTYPMDWPDVTKRGQYVTDYVGTSCSFPGTNGIQPYSATTPCPAHRTIVNHWSAPTGTAGVAWEPNADTNVYVRYNRGYKSGGFNLGALVAGSGEVGAEYIDDLEAGWKQNVGHNFQFDLAGFYYWYHGLQANNATIQNSSPPIVLNELVNIQESHAYGIELETSWAPIKNLLLLVNYSYLHAINDTECVVTGSGATLNEQNCFIDSANPLAVEVVNGQHLTGVHPVGPEIAGNQPQSLKGNPLPYSPEHKVSFNANYTFNFPAGDLTFSVLENYHASFYDNLFATQQWLVPSGDTTDFRVTWNASNKRYSIIGSVTNAFDHIVLTAYSTLPPSNAYYAYNSLQDPRIFSLEFRYHF
jgi:outer membrane receptor protein involved in Fe transport